jgi:hypothetical protein
MLCKSGIAKCSVAHQALAHSHTAGKSFIQKAQGLLLDSTILATHKYAHLPPRRKDIDSELNLRNPRPRPRIGLDAAVPAILALDLLERLLDVLRERAVEPVPVRVLERSPSAAPLVLLPDRLARLRVDLARKVIDKYLRVRHSRVRECVACERANEGRTYRVRLPVRFGMQLLQETVHLHQVRLERVEEALRLPVLARDTERDGVGLRN